MQLMNKFKRIENNRLTYEAGTIGTLKFRSSWRLWSIKIKRDDANKQNWMPFCVIELLFYGKCAPIHKILQGVTVRAFWRKFYINLSCLYSTFSTHLVTLTSKTSAHRAPRAFHQLVFTTYSIMPLTATSPRSSNCFLYRILLTEEANH